MNTKDNLLTKQEQDTAIKYYECGGSFQEIVESILHIRNEKIRRDMVREVGVLVSKRFNKQVYPIEFYGKVEEK